MLPSSAGGPVTQTVGFIHAPADTVAPWLLDGMKGWRMQPVRWRSLEDAVAVMGPARQMDRNAVVPVAGWSLLFRNSPLGNDVGVIPSLAARELGCRAVRAVCVPDGEDAYPARILEVYDIDGTPPLLDRRSITAANDGGSWVFETSGEPFDFEDLDAYKRRRKTERFPPELLYAYLGHLGVPYDIEPDWEGTQLLQRS
ncbi:hypothetical protein [Solirubrobacter soli]|uniref:hypothetical protein n=1 Tax=Solirubrobacter soli TaxID=363832 RepID=UPI00040B5B04|nr:hypothetical protein [Solirubrobacter soli]